MTDPKTTIVNSQALEIRRAPVDSFAPLVEMVTNTVASPNSKRAYRRACIEFLTWFT